MNTVDISGYSEPSFSDFLFCIFIAQKFDEMKQLRGLCVQTATRAVCTSSCVQTAVWAVRANSRTGCVYEQLHGLCVRTAASDVCTNHNSDACSIF
jgi:hypothetical protein